MAKVTPAANAPFLIPSTGYISAATMTGSTAVTGPWVYVGRHNTVTFQATWTGTPTGTFTASATLDADPDVVVLGPVAITISPTNPSGSASTTLVTFTGIGVNWLRLVYTNSGSTGVLNVGVSGHQ